MMSKHYKESEIEQTTEEPGIYDILIKKQKYFNMYVYMQTILALLEKLTATIRISAN